MSYRGVGPLTVSLLLISLSACGYVRTDADCAADLDAMREAVSTALEGATACVQDTDCVDMDVSNLCYGTCPVAVNRADVDYVDKVIGEAESAFCTGYMEQCGYTTPECPVRTPVCNHGRCEMAEPLFLYLVAPTL